MIMQSPPSNQKNPMDLLQEQVIRLSDIYKVQQEQLLLLRSQNEQIGQTLQIIKKQTISSALTHVKIEDVNMPFMALVGFLFKMTIAWVPVWIAIGIIYLVIILIVGGIFGT